MKKKLRNQGLKKWNKVLHIIVADYKKRKEPYKISDLRKQASSVYQDFKETTYAKIRVKDVLKSSEREIEVLANEVPDYWFDNQQNFTYWFQVGEWANRFANAYPNIPVMLITKKTKKTPLVVQGALGDYDGSIFQKWTEDLRETLLEPDKSDAEIDVFFGTPAYKDDKGQIYAVWFENGVKIPKLPPKPQVIEPRKKALIEKAELIEKERREIEKPPKKRGRPKKEEGEKKPLPKIKKLKKPIETTEKPQANRVAEIRKLIGDLEKRENKIIDLVKNKLISKAEFKKQQTQISNDISELTRKLEKGGKV